jgi:hypothetical protein
LGSPCTLTGLFEAIVNAEVRPSVVSLLASATLVPLHKLDTEQRRAQEQELRDQKVTLRPIWVWLRFRSFHESRASRGNW